MKVIVINAAPRMEKGNTQMMLTPFLVGMRSEGANIDVAFLGRKNIKSCTGCFSCYATTPGVCVQADDFPLLAERIHVADMMLFATPVYLDGMTGLGKVFIDRLVQFLDPHFTDRGEGLIHPLRRAFPDKLALLSVCGYPGLHNFDPLVLHMERIAGNLHAALTGKLLRPAVFSCLMTSKYPERIKEIMDATREAGEELVRHGRISEAAMHAAAADICSVEELKQTANAYWDRELNRPDKKPS